MPRILIIDDEEGVRFTLRKIMEKEGYTVDTAPDSESAIKLLGEQSYETIITDIMLPGISGIELLKIIRQHDQELPVIIITGYADVETAAEAVRQSAYDYVEKPITRKNLPPVVSRAIEKRRLIDEKERLEKENFEYQRDLEKKVKERTQEIENLNKTIKESQEKLILSERLSTLGTFVSFISHDLRNPLSVIQNAIYYLRTKIGADNPKIEKYFNIIEEEVNIANSIIDNFLAFTKGRTLNLQATDINALIEKVLDILIQIPENINTNLQLSKDLPLIPLERDQIQQVLVNIINNAIQAMPEGGSLTIHTRIENNNVCIDISDTGVGISLDDLDRLFDPFFTKKAEGTGLGLVICKFVIERHYGKIKAISELGKGSTFSIILPLSSES